MLTHNESMDDIMKKIDFLISGLVLIARIPIKKHSILRLGANPLW